ncbi:MAG TPA: hypothetical protein VFQ53_25615 [Kofleriaceae bacterium]|nr:hypothetical protein [Kofleriaceae bacterium]
MPRSAALCAVIFVGGCFFQADYNGGPYACPDGKCPSGLVCSAQQLCLPQDAPTTDAVDAPDIDARVPAFTCADPGSFPATGGNATGTTAGKPFNMSSLCGGFVMNGPDAVYKIPVTAGKRLTVSIDAGGRKAYVVAACVVSPNTPACLGNSFAKLGNPITVMPAAGDAFVVVDDEFAAGQGDYTLSVTVTN